MRYGSRWTGQKRAIEKKREENFGEHAGRAQMVSPPEFIRSLTFHDEVCSFPPVHGGGMSSQKGRNQDLVQRPKPHLFSVRINFIHRLALEVFILKRADSLDSDQAPIDLVIPYDCFSRYDRPGDNVENNPSSGLHVVTPEITHPITGPSPSNNPPVTCDAFAHLPLPLVLCLFILFPLYDYPCCCITITFHRFRSISRGRTAAAEPIQQPSPVLPSPAGSAAAAAAAIFL